MSGKRRKSRELALQVLFQAEFLEEPDLPTQLQYFKDSFAIDAEVLSYSTQLLEGIRERQKEIDGNIEENSPNWSMARMTHVDRSILRLAGFEILSESVPPKVAIDEAVELAKKYGSSESSSFVNGILDAFLKGR